jgi:hypothetical protein
MPFQVATFEGYHPIPGGKKMPRKRKGGGSAAFTKAAKHCARAAKRSGRKGAYMACMRKELKKKRRRR